MKEYEKMAVEYFRYLTYIGPRDPIVQAFIQGFLTARNMAIELLPNSPDIDFKLLEQLGDKET
jgi:hypothetical protein